MKIRHATLMILLLAASVTARAQLTASDSARAQGWSDDIEAFMQADRENPPPERPILFVGSSSIRMWKSVDEDFSKYRVLNRGFGGSHLSDVLFYLDQLVLKYEPAQIVLYEGDNDVYDGKTPERMKAYLDEFVSRVRVELPDVPISVIAIKPSPARAEKTGEYRAANRLMEQYCRNHENMTFIDVFEPMLDEEGNPRRDIFIEDMLHMNKKGYDLWTRLVRPHLVDAGVK